MCNKKCKCCGNILSEQKFYHSKNLDKYPDGRLDICKECIIGMVNESQFHSFYWVLRECDVPFFYRDWYSRLNYEYKSGNFKAGTILTKYLSYMRLKGYQDYRWEDTALFHLYRPKREEEYW